MAMINLIALIKIEQVLLIQKGSTLFAERMIELSVVCLMSGKYASGLF
jgi:hypothetical protein